MTEDTKVKICRRRRRFPRRCSSVSQEAICSKGDSDLAPAMVYCAMSQNESKTLLLGIVKILFPHRMFVVSVWNSTRTH
jgi:hypothetical protein